MTASGITHLIINSPFSEPQQHWHYHRETLKFTLDEGRRPAGYVIASESSKSFDDPGRFIPLDLVNQMRPRVKAWRENGENPYSGVTGITRRLLQHWNDAELREGRRFFFCQLEAIETLIWLVEAPHSQRVGIDIPSDGGTFQRLCSKLATGTGKTIVMAMVIAWQVLNRVADPRNERYAKNVLVVAPGLTVKNRLQVLLPAGPGNYYDEFNIVPLGLREQLHQGKVIVRNWHALNWESEEQIQKRRSVDKRGAKSDEAYVREVLGEIAMGRNILVLNDEAHHAWRVNPETKTAKIERSALEEATKWVGGLDRIHRARGISRCFDFSATPFSPSGKQSSEEAVFTWIVSDFGLNDAIESGLVKTPRVVVRDDALVDAKTYKSKLYHIYQHVRDDLNRNALPDESLPDLVTNAYLLLGHDWNYTRQAWESSGYPTPPVMITVANRTETAARVKTAFDKKRIFVDELCNPERTLHIDSKVLEVAEAKSEEVEPLPMDDDGDDEPQQRKLTKAEQAELLRLTVDTVGQVGQPGAMIQNVISVGMLSEGWDAKTVTHIMGLRAFSSQLLCEQVVGRGLRRTSYELGSDGLFAPEYVNIFGIPFTFLPHEGGEDSALPAATPKTRIEPERSKAQFAMSWPNIIRIDHGYVPRLKLDLDALPALVLDATEKIENAEMAAMIAGKPHPGAMSAIDLLNFAEKFRYQRIIFEAASAVYDRMKPNWKGTRENLLAQSILLVETFMMSSKLQINPGLFYQDVLKRRVMLTLHMSRIVNYVFEAIHFANAATIEPVFDSNRPIRSTGDMQTWFTGKPVAAADRSHINYCIVDSTWESQAAYELDHNDQVSAWVKNDHLGFEIGYIFSGTFHKYRPDYLIRLSDDTILIAEIKGENNEQARTKDKYLNEWVTAVNTHGGFGRWTSAVCLAPPELPTIIHNATTT